MPTRWLDIVFALYLGLVCAIALTIGTITAGNALTTLVDMAFPYEYAPPPVQPGVQTSQPATQEWQARERVIQRHNNLRSLLHSAIYFLLVGGVFSYHWRMFRARLKAA